jgi:hypothetical protein
MLLRYCVDGLFGVLDLAHGNLHPDVFQDVGELADALDAAITLNQPYSPTSMMSCPMMAPSSFAFSVIAWMSSTPTQASQWGGTWGFGLVNIPPPVPSPTLIMV